MQHYETDATRQAALDRFKKSAVRESFYLYISTSLQSTQGSENEKLYVQFSTCDCTQNPQHRLAIRRGSERERMREKAHKHTIG